MNTEFIFTCKRILLVEDDPRDVELTLAALAEHQLTNEVTVAHDGALLVTEDANDTVWRIAYTANDPKNKF